MPAFLSTSRKLVPLSDTQTPSSTDATLEEVATPTRQITDNDVSFHDWINGTMVDVEDGQLVSGEVVKIDRDEVLLDIGYKSEGVIPARELSIRNDVNPHEIVTMGERLEALVLT
jgi:small subunit ribosomal protein S1